METQNIETKLRIAEQEVAKARKEVARLQVHKKMADKYLKLMEVNDLDNRYQTASGYTCGSGPALGIMKLLHEIDPVASLLHDCQLNYCGSHETSDDEKYERATNYMRQIAQRTIKQETYESLLNGTEPLLGEYIQTIINPGKQTLLGRLFGGKK